MEKIKKTVLDTLYQPLPNKYMSLKLETKEMKTKENGISAIF